RSFRDSSPGRMNRCSRRVLHNADRPGSRAESSMPLALSTCRRGGGSTLRLRRIRSPFTTRSQMPRPLEVLLSCTLVVIFAGCTADAAPEPAGETASAEAEAGLEAAPAATGQASPAVPAGPVTDFPPNELGSFLVLEYHRLGEPEGEFVRKA